MTEFRLLLGVSRSRFPQSYPYASHITVSSLLQLSHITGLLELHVWVMCIAPQQFGATIIDKCDFYCSSKIKDFSEWCNCTFQICKSAAVASRHSVNFTYPFMALGGQSEHSWGYWWAILGRINVHYNLNELANMCKCCGVSTTLTVAPIITLHDVPLWDISFCYWQWH